MTTNSQHALRQTDLEGLPKPKRGKVRDIYDLGETLLIVACDRLSAYDHVLSPAIPDKGKILNQLTNFWFDRFAKLVPNHLLEIDATAFPSLLRPHEDILQGRSVLVKKAHVVPFECVARGFLAGSAFREYAASGRACGHSLPANLVRASRLQTPIFTPATKAESGHDENIDYGTLEKGVGKSLAAELRSTTLALFAAGGDTASKQGLLLADTKFEFGHVDGRLMLIDEVLTPDSSRYWEASEWTPGTEPQSFDKQFVRNWLDGEGWDHETVPPVLPEEVVQGTRARYLEAFQRLTGTDPEL